MDKIMETIGDLIRKAQELKFEKVTYLGGNEKDSINLSILQKWLREEVNMLIYVTPKQIIDEMVWVNNIEERTAIKQDALSHAEWEGYHKTYEEALFAGISKALEYIENAK